MSACDLLQRPLKGEALAKALKAGHSLDCCFRRLEAPCPLRAWEQYPDTPLLPAVVAEPMLDVGPLEEDAGDALVAAWESASRACSKGNRALSRMGAEVRRLRDENERLKARVAALVKVGTGETPHDGTGRCPDEDVNGFEARADGCPACKVLGPAEGGR